MPAVRVSDALRYASKFVALTLAVVIVAGGLIAGGIYLAADAISFTDPSLSALSETPVFIGIVLLVIGAIVALIGWIALAYKFLADGIATAMDARGLGRSAVIDEGATPDADENTEVDEDIDADEASTDGSDSDTTAVGGAAATAGRTDDEPGDGIGDDRPSEPPTTHPTGAPVGAPTEASEDGTDDSDRHGSGGTGPSESATADSMEETVAEPDRTEPDEPPEWTPPDPAEFESNGPEPAEDESSDDAWADETRSEEGAGEDPESIDEDATLADEGVQSFSTASEEDPLSDRLPGSDDT